MTRLRCRLGCELRPCLRYGKWIEIIFGRAGNIKGAIIQTYLLEKSRVITLDPGERSYHVFYQVQPPSGPLGFDPPRACEPSR